MTRVSAELHDQLDQAAELAWFERQATQMTLDYLIATLQVLPSDLELPNLKTPHGYYGRHCDLALEIWPGSRTVAELLTECQDLATRKIELGKRSDPELIEHDAPVWVTDTGEEGLPLLAVNSNGTITLGEDIQPVWGFPKWINIRVWGEDF